MRGRCVGLVLLAGLLCVSGPVPGAAQEPTWQEVVKLVAEDAASFDEFGVAVAISGDTAVVGAWEDDDLGGNSGSAYVFERDAGGPEAWGQVAKLLSPDGAAVDRFGNAVAIDGDTVVVGAPQDGVFTDGYAWVFDRDAGGVRGWAPVTKLTGSDGNFGIAVAIDESIIAIGSSFADYYPAGGAVDVFRNAGSDSWKHVANLRPAAGGCIEDTTVCGWSADARFGASVSLDGDLAYVGQSDLAGAHSYVFHRLAPGSWARVARPLPTSEFSGGDQFALAVAVSGETLLAGAPGHDGTAGQAGTVFVFERDPGGPERWREVTELAPDDLGAGDKLGHSVDLDGDTAVAGATESSQSAPGYAYVFERDAGGPGAWGPVAKLTASDGVDGDDFGWSVAIDGDTVVVGAPDVNDQTGAAYVFQEVPSQGTRATRTADADQSSETVEPPSPGLLPVRPLHSPGSGLAHPWISGAELTHLCFDFTFACDGLELFLQGTRIQGRWRNTDCEGTDVPVRGRLTATHAVVGCDAERDPCPLGSEWNFIFDGSLDGTVDMHRFEATNWNSWIDELDYSTTPGACPF